MIYRQVSQLWEDTGDVDSGLIETVIDLAQNQRHLVEMFQGDCCVVELRDVNTEKLWRTAGDMPLLINTRNLSRIILLRKGGKEAKFV